MLRRFSRALKRRRSAFGSAMELTGFGFLVAAGWTVAPGLGLALGGVTLVMLGFTLSAGEKK